MNRRRLIPALLAVCAWAAATVEGPATPPPANQVEIITSGAQKWELLTGDLAQASQAICLEYFTFANDSCGRIIGDILMRKAQEGVPVRMILENVAHPGTSKSYYKDLQKAGVEVRFFTNMDAWPWDALPGIDQRDHRKIVTIDGRIGYTGGMNISKNYHRWTDTHLRIEGPAVAELEDIFYRTWHRLGGEGEPVAPIAAVPDTTLEIVAGTAAYPVFQKRFVQTFSEAHDYLYIETPYFCPTDTVVAAIKAAAVRGVDVRLLVPKVTDHPALTLVNQSFFPSLLEAGVRVYQYLPGFNHSKVIIMDDRLCWIGSVNLNRRSLVHDNEIAARIIDPDIAEAQKENFLGLLSDSHEVTLDEVQAWTPWQRFSHRIPLIIKNQL